MYLELGMVIEPFGTISAVAYISCERYYFLLNRYGIVSMMPADVVESDDEPLELPYRQVPQRDRLRTA